MENLDQALSDVRQAVSKIARPILGLEAHLQLAARVRDELKTSRDELATLSAESIRLGAELANARAALAVESEDLDEFLKGAVVEREKELDAMRSLRARRDEDTEEYEREYAERSARMVREYEEQKSVLLRANLELEQRRDSLLADIETLKQRFV